MAVTIVRGVASLGSSGGSLNSGTNSPASPVSGVSTPQVQNNLTQSLGQLSNAVKASTTTAHQVQEAAVVSFLRPSRVSSSGEKLREFQDAKSTADNVADKIRGHESEAGSAHGDIDAVAARESLAN